MAGHPPAGLNLLKSAATGLRRALLLGNGKAAPVFRNGFGIIPANLFYCTTARKIVSILRTDPFTPLRLDRSHNVEKILVIARLTGTGAQTGAGIPKFGPLI